MKKYPSKVILFGEYTVLLGGDILATPFHKYSASWSYGQKFPHPAFLDHFKQVLSNYPTLVFNDALWTEFEQKNGFLDTSIPVGYGLGSSGSLVAAFFDTFVISPTEFVDDKTELKKLFGLLESYFHGNSSGIDPLLSFIQQPIIFNNDELRLIDFNIDIDKFELIDSGSKRYMERLVATFVEKLENDAAFNQNMQVLKIANNNAIDALMKNDNEEYRVAIDTISQLQFLHLGYLITDSVKSDWEKSLKSDSYRYKLCGAGGGGFYLRVKF